MSYTLKPGDRVRITARNRVPGYQPGDTGTVTSGPHAYPSGAVYYRVTMDAPILAGATLFLEDEIERDEWVRNRGGRSYTVAVDRDDLARNLAKK